MSPGKLNKNWSALGSVTVTPTPVKFNNVALVEWFTPSICIAVPGTVTLTSDVGLPLVTDTPVPWKSITVAAADANRCSKLVVIMFSSFRVDRSTAIYTFSDSRIARSAPSSANSGNVVFGIAEANNNPEIYDSVTNVYVDESLSNADHTYTLQFRNGTGNAITAGNTYPRYGEFYVMVVGVK